MCSYEREGLLETVSRLSAWSPHPSPVQSICRAFRGTHWDEEGPGGQVSGEWLKDLGLLAMETRKLRELLRGISMSCYHEEGLFWNISEKN